MVATKTYRSIVTLLMSFFSLCLYSQVGINTNDPKEVLHVASPSSNIKVEGLSKANNIENLGGLNITRVYANAFGDLVLGSPVPRVQVVLDSENYLRDNGGKINQTGGGTVFTEAGTPNIAEFELLKDAIIEINYSVSWSISKNSNRLIDDGRARIIQTAIAFKNGNNLVVEDLNGKPINTAENCNNNQSDFINCLGTSGLLGLSGQFYVNSQESEGAFENFHNSASDYLRLPKGTYTAVFFAQLSVENTNGQGNVSMTLGTGNDELQIIAYYYD